MTATTDLLADPRDAGGDGAARQISLGRLGGYVGFRLRRVQNQLSRNFAMVTANECLRSGLFSSLAIVEANPGISQSELAREVGFDKSVMVSIVDEMERFGWAERRRSLQDRRRHALFITPAGANKLEHLFSLMEQTEAAVLHQLSAQEMQMLSGLLDRMYAAIVRDEG